MTWLTAVMLAALALPALLARLAGGYPPRPVPELAALAPLAVVPAIAAVIVAAYAAWWLAVLPAFPAALLATWQLPPSRHAGVQAAAGPSRRTASAATTLRLRLLTVNARGGAADPAALLRILQQHDVDVFAVQELTPLMVARPAAAGLMQVLPVFSSRPAAWLARHRFVGALADGTAPAGPGFGLGYAAGAHRSARRISGDADRSTSSPSRVRTCGQMAA